VTETGTGTVEISVRGESHVDVPAQLGTVSVVVWASDREAAAAYDRVVSRTAALAGGLAELADAGVVLRWSADPVERYSDEDPGSSRRKHRAHQFVRFTMTDRDRLTDWLGVAATDETLRAEAVQWSLTDEESDRRQRAARTEAVADARRRAQDYADAAGLGPVRLTALADVGLLGETGAETGGRLRAMSAGMDLAMTVRPEGIRVSAQVDARFTAEPTGEQPG
jgi:uncharacterized protein